MLKIIKGEDWLTKFILLTLYLFCFSAFASIVFIGIKSTGKPLLYEDSFALLKSDSEAFINWALTPHNGHPIVFLRILDTLLVKIIKPFAGYNILISSIILLLGMISISKTINIYESNKLNALIATLSSWILWLSPWQWENIIWEFQTPWFLISTLVLIHTFCLASLNKKKELSIDLKYIKLYLLISPLIAIVSSGQGICYSLVVIISGIYIRRVRKSSIVGGLLSIGLLLIIKLSYSTGIYTINDKAPVQILNSLGHFIILFVSIFKASISSFNQESKIDWIIPIISSTLLITTLIKLISKKATNNRNMIKVAIKNGSFSPAIFAIIFGIITCVSRSNYGFHQAAVSRYLTCSSLLPISLILIICSLNGKYLTTNDYKRIVSFKHDYLNLGLIFSLLLIINSVSFYTTISQTQVAYSQRQKNFMLLLNTCDLKLNKSIKEDIREAQLEEMHKKFYSSPGVNIPPQPGSNNYKYFKKNLESKICKSIIYHY